MFPRLDGFAHTVSAQIQLHVVQLQLHIASGRTPQVRHRAFTHFDPAHIAFQVNQPRCFCHRMQPWIALTNSQIHHPGFPQRGQHPFDIAQEHLAGSHHQHSLGLQLFAMRIEQIGRPVQRHRGFPGTRPALHHQKSIEIGTNHPVLFGLNRGNNVGHVPVSGAGQCRHQRAFALQPGTVLGSAGIQQFVFYRHDAPQLGSDVAPASHPQVMSGRGLVKGLGRRCAPIHQHLM